MKKTSIASAVSLALAGGSILSAGAAYAQEVDDRDDVEAIEEIVTTGSRIRKDAFTSSTPLSVIDVGEASVQGIANVGELLQANTAAAGSAQVTSAITTETGGLFDGGLGINSISLRGLGASRTLVLLNGRRAGPAGTGGAVSAFDLSVLPLATIERVEILKDGASSIYGSDAVAGVAMGLLPLGVDSETALRGGVNLHLFILSASILSGAIAFVLPVKPRKAPAPHPPGLDPRGEGRELS